MSAVLATDRATGQRQYATFYVGDMLLGVDIGVVQEINRQSHITQVPHAPRYVRGVINLRGEVSTVIDLRTILGLPAREFTPENRNLIVHYEGESIGLFVDRIADILTLREEDISDPPGNVDGVDGRLIAGVCTLESEIVVLLDIEQVLSESNCQE